MAAVIVDGPVADVRHRQGRLIGRMEALGFRVRIEAEVRTLTADVVKSSEIEGERLDADQVRSSIARRLGMDAGALKPADRHPEHASRRLRGKPDDVEVREDRQDVAGHCLA